MKRTVFFVALCALMYSAVAQYHAHRRRSFGVVAAAGSACTNLGNSSQGAQSTDFYVGQISGTEHVAALLVASNTYTVCAIDLSIRSVGSPVGSIWAHIWADDAGTTPTNQMSKSDPIDSSTISADETWVNFTGLDASLVATSNYWVGISKTNLDADNYIVWESTSAGFIEIAKKGADGTNWVNHSTSREGKFILYYE